MSDADRPTTSGPNVDGRRRDAHLAGATARARRYTPEWDPETDDVGSALLGLFAELAADVTGRLDRTPEKHRAAFFDELGFDRAPPQPARVPLVFAVADGLTRNVPIAPGTQAVAPPEGDGEEQAFEIVDGGGFEATPANLTAVYSVDPTRDAIYEHLTDLEEAGGTPLFSGESRQSHTLYLAHTDFFTLSSDTVFEVLLEGKGMAVLDALEWEYYGTAGEDTAEDWYAFDPSLDGDGESGYGRLVRQFVLPEDGEFVETTLPAVAGEEPASDEGPPAVTELESRWVRATYPTLPAPDELYEATLSTVSFSVAGVAVRPEEGDGEDENGNGGGGGGSDGPTDGGTTITVDDSVGLAPDVLLANDVPLPIQDEGDDDNEDVYPFGRMPLPLDAFYIASDEAFSKKGTTVKLEFHEWEVLVAELNDELKEQSTDEPLDLSWEYWNGAGWSHLSVDDNTLWGSSSEVVSLQVNIPSDIGPTTVSGHEHHWIRVRVLEEGYIQFQQKPEDEEDPLVWEMVHQLVPSFQGLELVLPRRQRDDGNDPDTANDAEDPGDEDEDENQQNGKESGEPPSVTSWAPDHTVPWNNLGYGEDVARDLRSDEDTVSPFVELPDATAPDPRQTLYLGFDAPLDGGPLQLLFATVERTYGSEFYPRTRWEYCEDPDDDRWAPLGGEDGTEGFLRLGIVGLTFPEATTAFERFGRDRHWIRARLVGSQFETGDGTATATTEATHEKGDEGPHTTAESPNVCGPLAPRVLSTDPRVTEAPPKLRGIYPNAGWADNVRTVADELLGPVDGTPDLTVEFANSPVVDEEVWVDELAALSTEDRDTLMRDIPERVDERTDDDGNVTAFWVRWTAVENFVGSAPDDRHYVVDRTGGTVTFGDDLHGAIPPQGEEVLRTNYRTGGGGAGNVLARAVAELTTALAFVEGVTNPVPGSGGADAEATPATLLRAAKTLRDRNRAVTRGDVERLAMAASRELARARCLPGVDRDGDSRVGWTTVLLVPRSDDPNPMPSPEVKARVEEALERSAPAPLAEPAPGRIVVRGPGYVPASVRTDLVVADEVSSVAAVEERALARLTAYLHPLTGGPSGEGWEFGTLPCVSEFYALLERTEGVDHVATLVVTFGGGDSESVVTDDDSLPHVSGDTLVYSGTHDVSAARPTDERSLGGDPR